MSCCRCHPTLQQLSPLSIGMAEASPDLGAMPPPWVCAGRKPSGSCLSLFFPLFRVPKRNPLNNREGWCALALGGRRINNTHNNQTKDGFHIRVYVGEDALPGQSVWDVVSLLGAVNWTTTKSQKLKYAVALDGRWLIFFTQQPTKNTRAQRRRHRGRGLTRGGMHGGMKPLCVCVCVCVCVCLSSGYEGGYC
jgi:hypothetical protein